ncbi:MAG TPA: sugar ABC transporter substrate-binding protein [Ktedonobacteraceae bacterium]|nr:sugar ABC transporter substrate-binding protein [Ktedonobacteraceae bacterium]
MSRRLHYNTSRHQWLTAIASLLVILSVFLAACGGSSSSSSGSTGSSSGNKKLTIAFLRPGPDPYYQDGQRAAVMAGQQLGVNVQTYFSNNSQSQELANVQDAISKHVDGILMYAVSLSAESADVAAANAAHIPIFLLYGYDKDILPRVAGFEQVNLIEYGKGVGTWLSQHLASGKVAIITGLLGRGDAEAYAQGFREGLSQNPNLSVVAQLPGDWNRQKAQNATQDLITAHPDLKGLYVENEDMAIGAILALQRAGKLSQVTVVSSNGAPYGLEAISKGQIQASNTCSPALEAVMGLRLLLGVINHKTQPGHLYYSLTKFVTKANINEANPWVPTDSDVQRWLSLPLLQPVPDSQLPS